MPPRDQIEVNLKNPVEKADGEIIDKLVLRRPKVKQLRQAFDQATGSIDQARQLISRCAKILPALVDEMELDDFERCSDALEEILPESMVPKRSDEEENEEEGSAVPQGKEVSSD